MRKEKHRHLRVVRYILYRETALDPTGMTWTFLGSFTGIALIGLFSSLSFDHRDSLFLIGSFGATAVLLYGAPDSPLAQPRNLIGGHLLSALVGVFCFQLLGQWPWLSSAAAVSVSIIFMQLTRTLHPPGGATALIATIGSEKIRNLGFYYVLHPVLPGILILLAVALVVNNIPRNRRYPAKSPKWTVFRRINARKDGPDRTE